MPEPVPVEVGVHWLGHSTVLVELPGLTLLTDPVLRGRLGPLRRHGPVPDPGDLAGVDAVLLSHAHPDHFDPWSLRQIPGRPAAIVSPGLGRRVAMAREWDDTHELSVGGSVEVGGWRVSAVPTRHWQWPLPWDTPAVGFLVEGEVGVYFAGDTAAFPAMSDLAGRVDLALLPVGRWGPQRTPGHLSPRTAAGVAAVIGSRVAIPIHWGTFYPQGLERWLGRPLHEPGERFEREAARLAPGVDVRRLAPGERITFAIDPASRAHPTG